MPALPSPMSVRPVTSLSSAHAAESIFYVHVKPVARLLKRLPEFGASVLYVINNHLY